MNLEDLFTTKQYINIPDLQKLFDCGRDKATQIMRSIKRVSDTTLTKGKCTLADFELWYNAPRLKIQNKKDDTHALEKFVSPM